MVSSAIVTTNHRKSADVIVAKKSGNPELAAALSALSQMEQEIIFLYYFQRLTHREIGRRYGRAGNTTGRRIQMILRRLRAELEGLSYEPATSL